MDQISKTPCNNYGHHFVDLDELLSFSLIISNLRKNACTYVRENAPLIEITNTCNNSNLYGKSNRLYRNNVGFCASVNVDI